MSNDSSDAPLPADPLKPKQWGLFACILGLLAFVGVQYLVGGAVYVLFGTDLTILERFYLYGGTSILSLVLLWQILRQYGAGFKDIGLGQFRGEYVGYAFLAFIAYFVLSRVLALVVETAFPGLNLNQPQQIGFKDVENTLQLVAVFISLVVLPPLVEEALFRGLIFKGLMKYMPVVEAAIITSVVFGLAHKQLNVAIDTFALSLVLCFLVSKTKSLWPAIFLHATKNGVAFLFIFIFKITG